MPWATFLRAWQKPTPTCDMSMCDKSSRRSHMLTQIARTACVISKLSVRAIVPEEAFIESRRPGVANFGANKSPGDWLTIGAFHYFANRSSIAKPASLLGCLRRFIAFRFCSHWFDLCFGHGVVGYVVDFIIGVERRAFALLCYPVAFVANKFENRLSTGIAESGVGQLHDAGVTTRAVDETRGDVVDQDFDHFAIVEQLNQPSTSRQGRCASLVPLLPAFAPAPTLPGVGAALGIGVGRCGCLDGRQRALGDGDALLDKWADFLRFSERCRDTTGHSRGSRYATRIATERLIEDRVFGIASGEHEIAHHVAQQGPLMFWISAQLTAATTVTHGDDSFQKKSMIDRNAIFANLPTVLDRHWCWQSHSKVQAEFAKLFLHFGECSFAKVAYLKQLVFAVNHQIADRENVFGFKAVASPYREM